MKILVTGSAGFIGFHMIDRLLTEGHNVVGIDIINDYYSPQIKHDRIAQQGIWINESNRTQLISSSLTDKYRFWHIDLAQHDQIVEFMEREKFDVVIHLAAQAGVRYSLENPRAYTHSNIDGFLSILEGCRYAKPSHLIFASTSSVYGLNSRMPFKEDYSTEHPMALYAATKKANELMAHSYSHLFRIPVSGLRFFTVYGPWGRPDMALFLFADAILHDRPIKVYHDGNMIRDFTYVSDIVEAIARLVHHPAMPNQKWDSQNPNPATSTAPYRIYNIGNDSPISLNEYINAIEDAVGKKAKREYLPIQPGDVPITHSETNSLYNLIRFKPSTEIRDGVYKSIDWYRKYYSL